MKTERRQELQQNELADWIGMQGEVLKPYSKAIVGGFLLTAALIFAFTSMRKNQAAREAASWDAYFQTASEADIVGLREHSETYRDTEAGAWALQSAGDIGLATGSRFMFTDRGEAIEYLKNAEEDFQSAYNMAKTPMLRQRALMGLAQSQESLNKFDDASSSYEKLIGDFPDSPLVPAAEENLALLQKPSTKQFYDWFFAQKPARAQTPDPLGGLGIKPPSPYGDLPSDPATSLPNDSLLGGSGLMPPDSGTDKEDDSSETDETSEASETERNSSLILESNEADGAASSEDADGADATTEENAEAANDDEASPQP